MVTNYPGERGFTVIELMMAMSLLLIGLAMFVSVLFTVQQSSSRQIEIGRANDQARLAIQEIDRQLRSGYVASSAAFVSTVGSAPDASTRIYTEARMSGSSSKPQCVGWVLYGPGAGRQTLYSRTWTAGTSAPQFNNGSGWRVVATDIVNSSNYLGDSQTFDLKATDVRLPGQITTVPIGQSLTISLWVNPSETRPQQATQILSTLTSRNIQRGTANAEVSGGGLGARYQLCG